jgi:cytochrome c nitrite reductase small subunit
MRVAPLALGGLATSVLFGTAAGVGGYVFLYARGASYLSDDPAACANCHIMREQFAAWTHAPHHQVAVCNDCHTPAGLVPKYVTKALNGYHHSLAFTSGAFHEPIRIKSGNRAITEARCRSCHQAIIDSIDRFHGPPNQLSCIRCHADVGHMH